MKRFNSFPPYLLPSRPTFSQVPGSCLQTNDWAAICCLSHRRAAFHPVSFIFFVSSFHVSKSKSCDLIFPAAIIFSPPTTLPHPFTRVPCRLRACAGWKLFPFHAGTSLHCTDGWLKGLLFVSWFYVWQGRRRIRWLTAVITLRRTDYLSQTFSKPSTVFLNKHRKQTNKQSSANNMWSRDRTQEQESRQSCSCALGWLDRWLAVYSIIQKSSA